MKPKIKITAERIKFMDNYGELDDSNTLKEILFANQLQFEKLEKIRSNTSKLVWWLVVVPIIIIILILLLKLLGVL